MSLVPIFSLFPYMLSCSDKTAHIYNIQQPLFTILLPPFSPWKTLTGPITHWPAETIRNWSFLMKNLRQFRHDLSDPATLHNQKCSWRHRKKTEQKSREKRSWMSVWVQTSEEDLQVGWQRARSQDCSHDLRASYIHHHMFSEWEQVYQLNEPLRHMWGVTGGGGRRLLNEGQL